MAISRRSWISSVGSGLGLAAAHLPAAERADTGHAGASPVVDFRHSPAQYQTAFCFPDDPHKSLVRQDGALLYGHQRGHAIRYFPTEIQFSLSGMDADRVVRQELESPQVPIVHTRIERPRADLLLTTFGTNREGEGRVDNVLLEVRPRSGRLTHSTPVATVRTRVELVAEKSGATTLVYAGKNKDTLLFTLDRAAGLEDDGNEWAVTVQSDAATSARPMRCFFRLPQDGQTAAQLRTAVRPDELLEETRSFWLQWKPFGGEVSWQLPPPYSDFLTACARNIQQAREMRDGKLTFQVGPTVYRGLWVVDGHFILESARYLGYDEQARQGLETTWGYQHPDGSVSAGAGQQHWKDTAIAMFSLARQAELGQDWSYCGAMQGNVERGVRFLDGLRERARTEGSANGRYGLLARGFADGGMGFGAELTNTLWTLAGLKAIAEIPDKGASAVAPAHKLYEDLRSALDAAARQEMRRHPDGFQYLHMFLKDDPVWSAPEWDQPRPQSAQWALSHAIYPGLVFGKNDPIVRGHLALMRACTQEDVPIETGWLHHEGLWTYNAPFAAHAYLWAGMADWARRTFHGFLNHASPLYCWREEQPTKGSVLAGYVGDMPHNWASAECVLYLRHMLALEDGRSLRLMAGIGDGELARREPWIVRGTPTRFGRVHMALEPNGQGWRLHFERGKGPRPEALELPGAVGAHLHFTGIQGAQTKSAGGRILVDPQATSWTARWSPGVKA
ncbi:MAG: hypothetical protein U0Q18_28385 [Bryobacteraceae bacterium]